MVASYSGLTRPPPHPLGPCLVAGRHAMRTAAILLACVLAAAASPAAGWTPPGGAPPPTNLARYYTGEQLPRRRVAPGMHVQCQMRQQGPECRPCPVQATPSLPPCWSTRRACSSAPASTPCAGEAGGAGRGAGGRAGIRRGRPPASPHAALYRSARPAWPAHGLASWRPHLTSTLLPAATPCACRCQTPSRPWPSAAATLLMASTWATPWPS